MGNDVQQMSPAGVEPWTWQLMVGIYIVITSLAMNKKALMFSASAAANSL